VGGKVTRGPQRWPAQKNQHFFETSSQWEPPVAALKKALGQYIVKRDQYATVIAGYPWFLDWGRDTLIVVRGIIAAGRHEEARTIISNLPCLKRTAPSPT
jgi:glycogen debranching enzyme